MEHVAVDGSPKIVKKLTFPPTTTGKVNMIFTRFSCDGSDFEGAPPQRSGRLVNCQDVQSVTEPKLIVSPDLKEIEF